MAGKIFDLIIRNGPPAAGKSEVLDYLKKVPLAERIERFHVGEFAEFDDFPILWERFEDDDIYTQYGKERLISNTEFTYQGQHLKGYVFKDKFFWNYLIRRLCLNYDKVLRDDPRYHTTTTALFEFSRGSEHGGFRMAYDHLDDSILARACTLYINCSWEESLRKTRRRYNPNKPDSILEHALEDKKLEMLYKGSDWADFSAANPDHLLVKGKKVPFAILQNEPEITDQPDKLGPALELALNKLWKLHTAR